jgi:hypothetical protein
MSNYSEEDVDEPQLQWLENVVEMILGAIYELFRQTGKLVLGLLR